LRVRVRVRVKKLHVHPFKGCRPAQLKTGQRAVGWGVGCACETWRGRHGGKEGCSFPTQSQCNAAGWWGWVYAFMAWSAVRQALRTQQRHAT